MKRLRRLVRTLFRRRDLEAEMAEEMRQHVEHRAADLAAGGLPPEEARLAAQRRFGNTAALQEQARDAWGWLWLEQGLQDLRYAARSLRKSPGFTAIVVLTLSLGIGANAGIFSVLYALAWRPLPVRDPATLINLHQSFSGNSSRFVEGGVNRVSYPEFLHYRDRGAPVAELCAAEDTALTLGGAAAVRVGAVLASGNYFTVLGATAEAGRLWGPRECDVPGACAFVVLGHDFWQRQFGGERDIVGRRLSLNGQTLTVIGVAARNFRGAEVEVPDLWVPLTMRAQLLAGPDRLAARDLSWLRVIGRLRPGISREQARQAFALLATQSDADPAITDQRERRAQVEIRSAAFLNSPEDRSLGLPVAAVVVVLVVLILLLVSATAANLLLARATVRRQEIGVRLALGASRGRLVRQLLAESLLLAGGAGLVGLALTAVFARVLPALLPGPAVNLDLAPDWTVAAFCAAVSVAAGFVLGLLPALQSTRVDLLAVLAAQSPRLGGRVAGARQRHLLVIVQVAVSCVLLIAAGLLARGVQRGANADLGFEHRNLLVLSADPAAGGYDAARASQYYAQLAERLAALPGVKSLALAAQVPLAGALTGPVRPDTAGAAETGRSVEAHFNIVSPSYFDALAIPLVRGRLFTEAEARSRSRVAVISQAMADRFWPDAEALGQRFVAGDGQPCEVVGVVRDASSVWPGRTDGPFYYLATGTDIPAAFAVMVRTEGDWRGVAKSLREGAVALDPNVAVLIRPLEEIIGQVLGPVRVAALLAGALGLLAAALVAVGLYGVISYVVSQRTQEIGVRMALGADASAVERQIVSEGMRVAAAGLAPGLLLAASGSWALQSAIFGLSPLDPVTFAGVGALLLAVTALACWLPARRAAGVNPVIALRPQ